ncbi:MAG: hypothetical protein SNJ68_15020 [Cyanobacteriota bacterium]
MPQHLALIQSGFERGQYRQVLEQIRQAQSRYPQSGKLRLWQALAQEALGQTQEAILLAQALVRNPDPEVAQQARYILGIWQAPRLRRPPEWLSEIPDLSHLEDAEPPEHRLAYRRPQPKHSRSSPAAQATDASNPSGADRFDTKLIWVLIGILSALLAVLAGLP